jgi:hypothetical protein
MDPINHSRSRLTQLTLAQQSPRTSTSLMCGRPAGPQAEKNKTCCLDCPGLRHLLAGSTIL